MPKVPLDKKEKRKADKAKGDKLKKKLAKDDDDDEGETVNACKTWCFTWFGTKDDDDVTVPYDAEWLKKEKWFKYIIFAEEACPDTGRMHLQGYMELRDRLRMNQARLLMPGACVSMRKGTQKEAIDYCKFDDYPTCKVPQPYTEIGKKAMAGTRTDLDRTRMQALEEGMRGVTSVRNMQQIRVAEKFLTYNEPPRRWKPNVIWIWGPSEGGKSYMAEKLAVEAADGDADDIYYKNDPDKWYEGYDNHPVVILDDFRDSWWPLAEMLSLLDRYPKRVQYKGGARQMRAKTMIITAPFHPAQMYVGTGEKAYQLIRRCERVIKMPEGTETTAADAKAVNDAITAQQEASGTYNAFSVNDFIQE